MGELGFEESTSVSLECLYTFPSPAPASNPNAAPEQPWAPMALCLCPLASASGLLISVFGFLLASEPQLASQGCAEPRLPPRRLPCPPPSSGQQYPQPLQTTGWSCGPHSSVAMCRPDPLLVRDSPPLRLTGSVHQYTRLEEVGSSSWLHGLSVLEPWTCPPPAHSPSSVVPRQPGYPNF